MKNASKHFVLLPTSQHVGIFGWHISYLFLDCEFHLCLDQIFFCWHHWSEKVERELQSVIRVNTKIYCTHPCSNSEYTEYRICARLDISEPNEISAWAYSTSQFLGISSSQFWPLLLNAPSRNLLQLKYIVFPSKIFEAVGNGSLQLQTEELRLQSFGHHEHIWTWAISRRKLFWGGF